MAEQSTPAERASAFTQAWTSHDMTTAAGYLADDIVFDGPTSHITGITDYTTFLGRFASTVTSAKMLAAYGSDDRAVVMYEVTNEAGTWTCADLLAFAGEKIQRDTLTFSLNAR